MRLVTQEQIVINVCETGYYGDGNTCTGCGTHKTTPASGSATTADQCKLTLF